nr:MAG: RNA-dependent RNA polymerase [XiangYun tombus-noda-like virus 9]
MQVNENAKLAACYPAASTKRVRPDRRVEMTAVIKYLLGNILPVREGFKRLSSDNKITLSVSHVFLIHHLLIIMYYMYRYGAIRVLESGRAENTLFCLVNFCWKPQSYPFTEFLVWLIGWHLYFVYATIIILRAIDCYRRYDLYQTQLMIWFYSQVNNHDALSKLTDMTTDRQPDLRPVLVHPLNHLPLLGTSRNHTHCKSAQLRTSVVAHFESVINAAGYIPYSVSQSNRDKGDGLRHYHMVKDLDVPYRCSSVTDEHVLTMIDVDYYVNINVWLQFFRPIMIYTFCPKTVTGRTDEATWKIINNQVHFNVAGGAKYVHTLWNYTGDTVSVVEEKTLDLLTYHVHFQELEQDPNRRIVVLIPKTRTEYPFYDYLTIKNGFSISQFSTCTEEKINIDYIYEPITDALSIKEAHSEYSVELKGRLYHAISCRMAVKDKLIPSDIERMLSAHHHPGDVAQDASILFKLMKAKINPNLSATNALKCHYQTLKPFVLDDGKLCGNQICDPLVTEPALFPMKSVNNDHATIEGRVTKVANNAVPPKQYNGYATEFLGAIINDSKKGIGRPLDNDTVIEIQKKPAQRARSGLVEGIMSLGSAVKLKAFMKAEAYSSVNDPRNITTCDPANSIQLAGFSYPFKQDILYNKPWYSPGKTPAQIEKRIAMLAKSPIMATDYTRFDGSMSKWLQQNIISAAYMRWVHDDYRVELSQQLKSLHTSTAYTATGVPYKPGYSVKSGSAITTDGNTLVSAFIPYCALRESGKNQHEALAGLGSYAGDDGITPYAEGLDHQLSRVCHALGLTVKTDIIPVHNPIPYCGRFFLPVGTTCTSICDPVRTISKLHLTANKNVSTEQALVNKAAGYLVTDRKTPVVGVWADTMTKKYSHLTPKHEIQEEQWRQTQSWNQAELIAAEIFYKVTDYTTAEVQRIEQEIVAGKIENPLHNVRPVKVDAVVEGEIQTVSGPRNVENNTQNNNRTINNKRSKSNNARSKEPTSNQQTCGENPAGSGQSPGVPKLSPPIRERNSRSDSKPDHSTSQQSDQEKVSRTKGRLQNHKRSGHRTRRGRNR